MILIDAVYINDGGGLVLLQYLLGKLSGVAGKLTLLLDARVKGKVQITGFKQITYMEASAHRRHTFYLQNKTRLERVLCFANIPPTVRLSCQVMVYFHNIYYVAPPRTGSLKLKLSFALKSIFLRFFKRNADMWLVQTHVVKRALAGRLKSGDGRILIIPLLPPLTAAGRVKRKRGQFFYPGNATPHKNHLLLLEAFRDASINNPGITLVVTVSNAYTDVLAAVVDLQKEGYKIINPGFIDRDMLAHYYFESEFLIYPSLTESFGLPLAEATMAGCGIIAADLPYTYEVCQPGSVFNPGSVTAIKQAIEDALATGVPAAALKTADRVDELKKLLIEDGD